MAVFTAIGGNMIEILLWFLQQEPFIFIIQLISSIFMTFIFLVAIGAHVCILATRLISFKNMK